MKINDENVFVDVEQRRRKKRHGPILADFLYDIVYEDLEGDKYFYDFVNRHRQKADNEFFERGQLQDVRGKDYLDVPTVIGIECICPTEWDGPSCEQSMWNKLNCVIFYDINCRVSLVDNFVSPGIFIFLKVKLPDPHCLNNGTYEYDNETDTFSCVCTREFEGKFCETRE